MASTKVVDINQPLNYWTIRIVFRCSLFCLSIIGIITFYIMIQRDKKFVMFLEADPVNGRWSDWSNWSDCNASCSNKTHIIYGEMYRTRKCDLPAPRNSGMYCVGASKQTEECINYKCNQKRNSYWSEWSQYSKCSLTCQKNNSIAYKSRVRKCKLDNRCQGSSIEYSMCLPSIKCPEPWLWSDFISTTECKSQVKKLCSIGFVRLERSCLKGNCKGSPLRFRECWYKKGCPDKIQPPRELNVFSLDSRGNINVTWLMTPYGEEPVVYKVYLELLNQTGSTRQLAIFSEKPIFPTFKFSPTSLSMYRTYNLTKEFGEISPSHVSQVRVSASGMTKNNRESRLISDVTNPFKVDGRWLDWNYWTGCTSKCRAQPGEMKRTRVCEYSIPPGYPPLTKPIIKNKKCKGKAEEIRVCRNVEVLC